MFRLIKIENGHTSVPEILKLPKSTECKIGMGIPLIMYDGTIRPAGQTDIFTYVSVAEAKLEDEFVYCHKVYPNMLFEADCEVTDFYSIGQLVSYICNDEGDVVLGISSGSGDCVEVVDISDVKRRAKITVRFLDRKSEY